MALYLPFIFFLILFIVIFRKRGMDASSYITLLFVITSFFSILYVDLFPGNYNKYLTYTSTIEYCVLIALIIFPVYRFNTKRIKFVTNKNNKFITGITLFFFFSTIIFILAYHNDLLIRLLYGDIFELRQMATAGTGLTLTKYPIYIEIFLYPIRFVADMSYVMIFIFFYSITFMKKKKSFNIMAIIGSLPAILMGIIGIDRSRTFYWIVLFGLCAVIFWPQMNNSIRKRTSIISSVFLGIAIFYISIVTIQRFSESDVGSKTSIISYAGQSYPNFCVFNESFNNPDGITLKYLFPSFHHFVLKDYDGNVELQLEMSARTGMECGVFYTLLGSFILSDGCAGPFIITFVFLFIGSLCFRKKNNTISFERFFVSYLLLLIPATGFIAYIYASAGNTITVMLFIFLLFASRSKTQIKKLD